MKSAPSKSLCCLKARASQKGQQVLLLSSVCESTGGRVSVCVCVCVCGTPSMFVGMCRSVHMCLVWLCPLLSTEEHGPDSP